MQSSFLISNTPHSLGGALVLKRPHSFRNLHRSLAVLYSCHSVHVVSRPKINYPNFLRKVLRGAFVRSSSRFSALDTNKPRPIHLGPPDLAVVSRASCQVQRLISMHFSVNPSIQEICHISNVGTQVKRKCRHSWSPTYLSIYEKSDVHWLI
jgi:hypothetical protein